MCKMTENMQADSVQSRQVCFVRCCIYGIELCKKVLTAELWGLIVFYSDKHINVIITPLELIFDTDSNIQLIIDKDLMKD